MRCSEAVPLPVDTFSSSFLLVLTMRIHSRSIWMRIPWLAGIAVVLGPEQVASTDTNLYFDWSPGYFKWGFEFLVETTAGPPDAAAPGQPATVTSSIVNYNGVVANNSEVMFYWECRDIVEGGELTSAILVDFTSGNQTIARGDWAGSGEQQLEGDVPYFPSMSYAFARSQKP